MSIIIHVTAKRTDSEVVQATYPFQTYKRIDARSFDTISNYVNGLKAADNEVVAIFIDDSKLKAQLRRKSEIS